jgi:hypothetical protein
MDEAADFTCSETVADGKIHKCLVDNVGAPETIIASATTITKEQYIELVDTIIFFICAWMKYHKKPIRFAMEEEAKDWDWWTRILIDSVNEYLTEYKLPVVPPDLVVDKARAFIH